MRFRALSKWLADQTRCGAVVVLAMTSAPALGREATPAIDAESAVNTSSPADVSAAPASRVFLAQPVGQVTVGSSAVGAGRRMYAARSQAGSASVISFSATQPRPAVSGLSTIGTIGAPLSRARLTSGFGAWRPAANGGSRAHAGVDLAAPTGTPVAASMPGRVSSAGWASGYGMLVVVQHANGVETRYAHLSNIRVSAGQMVRQGETVGLVGSTGRSTGPHLHYEIRQNGRPLNPLK